MSPPAVAMAQGLDSEQAIDTIIGSDVQTGEEDAAADADRILAAIEQTAANTAEVRRKFSLDRLEIVFLPDLAEGDEVIDAAIAENQAEITEMQEAIEGSAMFYHAVDSRNVMTRDIIAMEFDDENGVTIFARGADPQR
jgi:hypothetical protein